MELHHFFHKHSLALTYYWTSVLTRYCEGCCGEILGFSYSCQSCSFFLHKSCGEQPRQLRHPLHQQHPLILCTGSFRTRSRDQKRCYFCNTHIFGGFSYNCFDCNFNLHLKCASIPFTLKPEFHDHPLNLLRKSVSFICDLCGIKDEDMSYLCITCPLMVHLKCAALPLTVKHTSHQHSLNLTHSSQLNQSDHRTCRLCVKKVGTDRVYYCLKCNFVAHLGCATGEGGTDETFMLELKDKQPLESTGRMLQNKDSESIDSLAYVVKKMKIGEDKIEIPEEIKHFSHQHDLKLTDELLNNQKCDGCKHPIFPPFYSCAQCRFFLHKSCAILPKKKRHPLHPHLLTLLAKATYGDYFCNVCGRYRDGFTYRCVECVFDADVECSLISDIITHDGHEHQLILSRASSSDKCSCCDYKPRAGVFKCSECEFTLDVRCATLPRTVKHKYFEQPFKLCYKAKDDFDGEYYCDICEEERNPKHWFYYCEELNFPAHSKCILGTYLDVLGML